MQRTYYEHKSVNQILSDIGGRWTAVEIIIYFLAAFYLIDTMWIRQVNFIRKRNVTNQGTESVLQRVRERMSYVQLYELYDKHDHVSARGNQHESQINELYQMIQ